MPAAARARLALTREIGTRFAECELLHQERRPIDLGLARRQHAAYEATLAALGFEVRRLPPLDDHADAVFVEDTAVVLDEVAVLCRPGADSRRPETASVAVELRRHRPLARVEAPATLDGGDVLRTGRHLWVGRSRRTNAAGAARLAEIARPLGYRVVEVPVERCLHLKSAVTALDEDTVLLDPRWIDRAPFASLGIVETDPLETGAGNALAFEGSVIYPDSFPRTAARLAAAGWSPLPLAVSEIAKAEGGVTCCSLLLAS